MRELNVDEIDVVSGGDQSVGQALDDFIQGAVSAIGGFVGGLFTAESPIGVIIGAGVGNAVGGALIAPQPISTYEPNAMIYPGLGHVF
jgi:hypothetical protein